MEFLDDLRFQLPITAIARRLALRDRIFPALAPPKPSQPTHSRARGIPSGNRQLAASLHSPSATPHAVVLICHGIGERLPYWHRAQVFLSDHGIVLLVFAYSGYPPSSGALTPSHLRQDCIAAYAALCTLVPLDAPPFLLGLSLGTGIAIDAAPSLTPSPSKIILCQPFTSLRDAATAILRSRRLARLLPDLYRTEAAIPLIAAPLLLVHADADRLFPVEMSRRIHAAAVTNPSRTARLVISRGLAHNDAFLRPDLAYWQPILEFLESLHSIAAAPSSTLESSAWNPPRSTNSPIA
jgi:uncharacterized protein